VKGRKIDVTKDGSTDDYAGVMRMPLLRGRWFNADDEASTIKPIVIDADAANALFGTIDVVGRTVEEGPSETFRVIGVIAPYRKDGRLSRDEVRMVFERASLTHGGGHLPRELMIRVRPGTPADFEETLIKRLHAAVPAYTTRVQHLEQARAFMDRLWLAPAIAGAVVAAFLLTMVALGLSGVLWQTVTRRRRELGLRRALGATGAEVNRQILAEVTLLTTLAIVAGVALVAQLPLVGQGFFTPSVFTIGLAAALVTIYGLTLLCALYPSWLAGRIQPAQALHYE
jgi:putative ABC transport system permease protein